LYARGTPVFVWEVSHLVNDAPPMYRRADAYLPEDIVVLLGLTT
jgi:hypothetical protein